MYLFFVHTTQHQKLRRRKNGKESNFGEIEF